MRVFFGLELPPQTAMAIATWRDRYLPALGRPVPVGNFHLTLAFIGEVDNRALEKLCDSVEQWLPRCPGATLMLDEAGYFPRPGILWLGPREWPAQLDTLAGKLRTLGHRRGGKSRPDRFVPHVTLFRRCQDPPPAATCPPQFEFNYDSFYLYESRSGREGVSYHPLESWELPRQ